MPAILSLGRALIEGRGPMREELQNRLISSWPEIFRDVGRPLTESLMAFGIDTDDGWFELLDVLCRVLTLRATAENLWPPTAVQVKEKFGGLRFYTRGGDEMWSHGAIQFCDSISYRICEVSGMPGRIAKRYGWYKTLSPEIAHRKEYEFVSADPEAGTDPDPPLPPMSRPEVARILKARWPDSLRCVPQIDGGWLDIADILLGQFALRDGADPCAVAFIDDLREVDGQLVVRAVTRTIRNQGAVAMAIALAARTDPATGGPR